MSTFYFRPFACNFSLPPFLLPERWGKKFNLYTNKGGLDQKSEQINYKIATNSDVAKIS